MWNNIQRFLFELPPFAWNLLLAVFAIFCGLVFYWIISLFMRNYEKPEPGFSFLRSSIIRLGKPLIIFLPLLILNMILPVMKLEPGSYLFLNKITGVLLIISFAWILIAIVKVCEDYVVNTYDLKKENNLKERKIRTQLQFIRKLAIFVIVILAICAILLSFENLRRLGAGLLTGVGVGGIIVGFAAQRSLSNFLAGLQIAFTQPIRIDDVLIVEGEWGRVEEITLTYVVVNIWDERRMILPINYFIEKPFQNWTRSSSDIMGTAFFYLDYTAPVAEIRTEFQRLLQTTPLWDRRAQVLQVTNTTEKTIEIRTLMTASSSSRVFDLRCYVREHLITFIQEKYPQCLPKNRTMLEKEGQENDGEGGRNEFEKRLNIQ